MSQRRDGDPVPRVCKSVTDFHSLINPTRHYTANTADDEWHAHLRVAMQDVREAFAARRHADGWMHGEAADAKVVPFRA